MKTRKNSSKPKAPTLSWRDRPYLDRDGIGDVNAFSIEYGQEQMICSPAAKREVTDLVGLATKYGECYIGRWVPSRDGGCIIVFESSTGKGKGENVHVFEPRDIARLGTVVERRSRPFFGIGPGKGCQVPGDVNFQASMDRMTAFTTAAAMVA